MSKIENFASAGDFRPMTDAELDTVSGGIIHYVAAFGLGVVLGYGVMSMGLDIGERLQTGTLNGLNR